MIILLLLAFAATLSNAANTVWPKPQSQTDTNDTFQLDPVNFEFQASGLGASSSVLDEAFKRYRGIIFLATPTTLLSSTATAATATITTAQVTVASADESLTLETDASYNLTITQKGIFINANTV